MKKLILVVLLINIITSCTKDDEIEYQTSKNISVRGKVWDDYKNTPISNLKMYVYKSGDLYGNGYEIMSEVFTDYQGNYFMSFDSKDYGSYYVSFAKNNHYIFDSNNMEHYLNNSSNVFDFKIRKSKTFKTRLIVQNNYHRPLSIYNGFGTESQSVAGINKDTILYFKADPKEINMFQMYVQEMDYGHYWYKMEIKDGNSPKDTISIVIDADINKFKRYKANENP